MYIHYTASKYDSKFLNLHQNNRCPTRRSPRRADHHPPQPVPVPPRGRAALALRPRRHRQLGRVRRRGRPHALLLPLRLLVDARRGDPGMILHFKDSIFWAKISV